MSCSHPHYGLRCCHRRARRGGSYPDDTQSRLPSPQKTGGAPMVVSLGCEKLSPCVYCRPKPLCRFSKQTTYVVRMADEGAPSFGRPVAAIMELGSKGQSNSIAERAQRGQHPISSSGLQCGGSEPSPGHANTRRPRVLIFWFAAGRHLYVLRSTGSRRNSFSGARAEAKGSSRSHP